MTSHFKESRCIQHVKGLYLTDVLDNCWFYGGKNNRCNGNVILKIDDSITFIACSTYYDKNGYKRVKDYTYTPKKK